MNSVEEEQATMEEPKAETKKGGNGIIIASAMISVAMIIFSGAALYVARAFPWVLSSRERAASGNQASENSQEEVIPSGGVALPFTWGDLGKRLAQGGVINEAELVALYADRGNLDPGMKALLDSSDNGQIVMTSGNASFVLNLLWALGLGNKNPILESGLMESSQHGGAGNFASTGGWTLAQGSAMAHYDAHQFVALTPAEQSLVESVAKNIYRPCCGNSTYFPDCNHGMAMLGLLELMASQGATESQMYKAALAVNSYWFPSDYLTIAQYLRAKGIDWKTTDPKEILGARYSSAVGYNQVALALAAMNDNGGASATPSGGCGV